MPSGIAKAAAASSELGPERDSVTVAGRSYRVLEASGQLLWARPEPASTSGEVLMAGELRGGISVADVAAMLAQLGLRGELTVVHGPARRVFGFEQGALKSAFSNVAEERLGALMVSLGRVTRAQLDQCLAKATGGQRLGQVAMQQGLVNTEQLFELLQYQAKLAFQNGVVVDAGHYVFARLPDEVPFDTPFNMHLPIQGLLMESMQRIDEMQAFRKRIPDGSMRPILTNRGAEVALPQSLQPVAALCDGERSVLDISHAIQLDEFETTRRVYQLSQAGILDIAAPRKPVHDQCRETIEHFNELLDDVRGALETHAPKVDLLHMTQAWLRHSPFSNLFNHCLDRSAWIDPEQLLSALESIGEDRRLAHLLSALHELASYTMFAACAHLPPQAEATLARATQRRLAALGS